MANLRDKHGKQLLAALFVSFLAIGFYFFARSCSKNEESRIRKVIYTGVFCLEREDIEKCSGLILDNYLDTYGNTKTVFLDLLSGVFNKYNDIRIEVKQLNVSIDGEEARADVGFKIYFGITGGTQIYYDSGKLEIILKKDNGLWKAHSIRHVGSNELLFIQSVA